MAFVFFPSLADADVMRGFHFHARLARYFFVLTVFAVMAGWI